MLNALMIYLLFGAIANLYIHFKNAQELGNALMGGQLNVILFLIAGTLNHFVWPITLFLELTKKK
jgi:hypothetical protein